MGVTRSATWMILGNQARTQKRHDWVHVAGPLTGAVIEVGFADVVRGAGGGKSSSAAAQGDLYTDVEKPTQA